MKPFFAFVITLLLCTSCTVTGQIDKKSENLLLADTNIAKGFIGIKIFNETDQKVVYSHNAGRYFTPASNTKLYSLYAGMKYLGDSIPGVFIHENDTAIFLRPAGDPTLLHPEFKDQAVIRYLQSTNKNLYGLLLPEEPVKYGPGWGWSDYDASYMNERSALPVYGNNITFSGGKNNLDFFPKRPVVVSTDTINNTGFISSIERGLNDNQYKINFGGTRNRSILIPFVTSQRLAYQIIGDSIGKNITVITGNFSNLVFSPFYSQPADSLFKPMMENSDNFFAEQTLLMAANAKLGLLNSSKMIDTLLKTDLSFLPDKPQWADGSGLSRYNLFTPNDMVELLQALKKEQDFERVKMILPTGDEGTLKNLYLKLKGKIFAKTGTLNNNLALSGYLISKSGKVLIFSIMVNNYVSLPAPIRKSIESFLEKVWEEN